MKKVSASFSVLRHRGTLWPAWMHVRKKARKSTSSETRAEADKFSRFEVRNIERISEQLRRGEFKFSPAKAILISKAGKKTKRPVVVAPVESRIVQRALLDVIQVQPAIAKVLHEGFNFGGVEGRDYGVPAAVRKAQRIASEKFYYIRTDIRSFFTKVPRERALDRIYSVVSEQKFRDFLKAATDTELDDIKRLGDDAKLFPIYDEGVAQGSCLSPLLCNLLLSDFDRLLNARGVVCIRYIDDFILLADSKAKAFKALSSARGHLAKLGLDVYDPLSEDEGERRKADHGHTAQGFDFLGCTIKGGAIRPAEKNRKRLRESVQRVFDSALGAMSGPLAGPMAKNTYADAVRTAGLIIRGWGNTHAFCTDRQIMLAEDGNLGLIFDEFNGKVKRRLSKFADLDRRRALGYFLLQDCNVEPVDS